MCIAIVNKTSTLSLETFQNIHDNNGDGLGIAYVQDGTIQTSRTMDKVQDLHRAYLRARKQTDKPILIHARIGTHGHKSIANVHPFKIGKDLALIHNGIVSAPIHEAANSDTRHLVGLIASMREPARVLDDTLEASWIEHLTTGSKVALLHSSGRIRIFGEKSGHWSGDTWYSNHTYEACTYRDIGGTRYAKGYPTGWDRDYWMTRPTTWDKVTDVLEAMGHDNADIMQYATRQALIKEYQEKWGISLDELYKLCTECTA